jgi:TetR/AcrR family transcriptional regulator, mexJK operon transcriptional repressor
MRIVMDEPDVKPLTGDPARSARRREDAPAAQPARVKAGRPTREQAEARHAALLDRALDHFLERGYERATIEAIAAEVSMTKRTVYARYADKAELFLAAVRRGIDRHVISPDEIPRTRAADFEQTLINVARLRVELSRTPHGLKLQRIINTESYRFPEIFTTYYNVATRPTVRFLAALTQEEVRAGRLAIDDPMMAANVFLSMVVSGPVRIIASGNAIEDDDLEARLAFSVRLFLQGARPR